MRKSVTKTEQLLSDGTLLLDYDQPLTTNDIVNKIVDILGNNAFVKKIDNKKVVIYRHGDETECLLVKAITYLGKPHALFKKRIQLDSSINDFYINHKNDGMNIRLIGAYHYKDLLIFADFDKTQYLERKLHNSSAHVMINDLYQALETGSFTKVDYFNNKITTLKDDFFKFYLDSNKIKFNEVLDIIQKYNLDKKLDGWIKADEAINEMKKKSWYAWKETEWPGFYLEYLVNDMIKENNLENIIQYKGNIKGKDMLDFDLYFPKDEFYGDLKASDINKKICPGNDQINFEEAVQNYKKFWYVIYEHETIKDIDRNSEMAIKRMSLIGNEYKDGDRISYQRRMKYAVKFKKMYIIELNKINYRNVLKEFKQGHQYQSDVQRAPKFEIDKRTIDNYIIYSHEF